MSKIYKYSSASSGLKILKSGEVILSNPERFNDPFECRFNTSLEELNKVKSIVENYIIIKECYNVVANNKDAIDSNTYSYINNLYTSLYNDIENSNIYIPKELNYEYIDYLNTIDNTLNKIISKKSNDLYFRIINRLKTIIDNLLITCFSKRNDLILMWSHYSTSHNGVCFEYEADFDNGFKEVEYKEDKNPPSIERLTKYYIACEAKNVDFTKESFSSIDEILSPFYTKSLEWSYEREVRYITTNINNPLIRFDEVLNSYLIKLDITGIYIGSKAKGYEIDEIVRIARKKKIKVVFMKESNNSYAIVADEEHEHIYSKMHTYEKNKVLRLFEDINLSINNHAYISSLFLALTIPSIMGSKLYNDLSQEDRYIKWCMDYLPLYGKSLFNDDKKMPYPSPKVLYDLFHHYSNNGNFDLRKEYDSFTIDKVIIKNASIQDISHTYEASFEQNNDKKEYVLTIFVRQFIDKMIVLANKCYDNNIDKFVNDIIVYEDYELYN